LRSETWKTAGAGLSLILLGLAIFLPTLGRLPLIRAEAMYALIPWEMLRSGDWLTPTLNGARYLDKPPLLYWLNMAAFGLGGVSEITARLATFAIGLGEVLATFSIGRLLFSLRVGWLAGVILLTSIGFFALHEQILTDHLISLTLAWSLYFLLRWQQQPRHLYAVAFYLCLALGLLSKGFIGLVFPLAIGGLYCLVVQDSRLWRFFFNPLALLSFLALSLPWFIVEALQHPGFFQFHILNEQIMRFLGQRYPPDIVPFPIAGFWLFVFVWLMPWAAFLPAALARLWPRRQKTGDRRPETEEEMEDRRLRTGANIPGTRIVTENRKPKTENHIPPPQEQRQGAIFLIVWALVVLGFFTLSSSRIEYYSMPAFPAVALMVGWRLDAFLTHPKDRPIKISLIFLALVSVALIAVLPVLESLCIDNRREFVGMLDLIRPIAYQAVFIIPFLGLAGAVCGWLERPRLCLTGLGATSLAFVYFTFQCLAALSPNLSDSLMGKYLQQQAGVSDLIIMESIEEFEYGASLAFYAQRPILIVQRDQKPLFGFPLTPQENYLISPQRLQELWNQPHRVYLLVDDSSPPESYLNNAAQIQAFGGKRLLSNRPVN
jgi:4-amino-4-deoxy-L-arabinose transferase-like glycosyltransferase